jgi:LAO/AO transport system kinase
LSREENAFIRPSPAGDNLGGVARRTRETMLLCEAAGFDTVIVESVGVGQSEVALRSMVDFFLVLLLPGAGDELQGIKRGILELADVVLINKADGDNRRRAEHARSEHDTALHYMQPATRGWKTETGLCSGLTGEGVPELWERVERFYKELEPAGVITEVRLLEWVHDLIAAELRRRFDHNRRIIDRLPALHQAVVRGDMTAVRAAQELLEIYDCSGGEAPTR